MNNTCRKQHDEQFFSVGIVGHSLPAAMSVQFRIDSIEKLFVWIVLNSYIHRCGQIPPNVAGFVQKYYCPDHVLDRPDDIDEIPELLRDSQKWAAVISEMRRVIDETCGHINENILDCLNHALNRLIQRAHLFIP